MKYRYLLILLATLALFGACTDSTPDPGPAPGPEGTISLSGKTLLLDAGEEGSASVEVTADGAWEMEGLTEGVREWLAVDTESGDGNTTVTFRSTAFNPYDEPRIAVVTFRCSDATAPLVVRQANDPERSISLSDESLEFTGSVGEELTLQVITEKPWTLEGFTEDVRSWMSVDALSGEGNATVTLKALSLNMELADRVADLSFRIDRVHAATVSISQKTGITISASETELSYPSDVADARQLVITTTTDKYPWHVEGLTDEVRAWLSVTPESATGLTSQVTVSTLGANEGSAPRSATLKFVLSDLRSCSVEITQASPVLETFVISWKGSGSYNKLIKGGESSPHAWFPWLLGSTTLSSFPDFLNGKDGEVVATGGNYTNTATWLFKDNVTGEWIPLEMGPVRTATSAARVYYMNHGNDNLRWHGAYIKIPAREGFKLTHVYINSFNGASSNCLTLSTDKQGTQAVEGYSKVRWGKNDVFDKELTTTQPGVDYYISSIADRWIDGFAFTYTEVR